MGELITMIGELHPKDLQRFLENYNINDVDKFITFLYNLNEDNVQEVINEIEFNKENK